MDVTTLILFIIGFILLISGANLLVRGATNLADTLGISPLIVGLTIVAFGTSAPELAVNLQSAWSGKPDLAIGNIVGSNILNILLILGIGAVIAPLKVHKRIIQLEIPLMIGASITLLLLSIDGKLNYLDGVILLSGIIFYTFYSVKNCRQLDPVDPNCPIPELVEEEKISMIVITKQLFFIILGLILLVQGSQWLVNGAIMVAKFFAISELIIGLTIVSIGTSLPEVATVVIASMHKQQDLIVGNVVGSNLFNILLVLGITSIVAPSGIDVSYTALVFDIPIMIVVAITCFPIFFTGYIIDRGEGGLFLTYYFAYAIFLLLNATKHGSLDAFSAMMFWFVNPLTAITLLILVWQEKD